MEIYAPPLGKWFNRGYERYRSHPNGENPPLYAVEEQRAWISGVERAMHEDVCRLYDSEEAHKVEDLPTTFQVLYVFVKDTELLEQLTALV